MTESDNNNEDVKDEKQHAPRARNRTVMLSPDITGEMRAKLADDFGGETDIKTATRKILPNPTPEQVEKGFETPKRDAEPVFASDAPEPEIPTAGFKVPRTVETSDPQPAFSTPKPVAPSGLSDTARLRSTLVSPAYGATPPTQSITSKPAAEAKPAAPRFMQEGAPQPRPAAPRPAQPQVQRHGGDAIVWDKPSALTGFLVSFDKDENGQVFELKSGRLIVTSEVSAGGSYLLLTDESVSPMHAILKVGKEGELQVLDQLSENGTEIKNHSTGEVQTLSGEKGIAKHGDTLSFGDRVFHVCLVWRD